MDFVTRARLSRASSPVLTSEIIRDVLSYDPETGNVTWNERDRSYFPDDATWKKWNTRWAGKNAGSFNNFRYRQITVLWNSTLIHRVAWIYMTGEWPEFEIDHINHDRSDNRWSNLRSVGRGENVKNSSLRKDNISGHAGISWSSRYHKWRAEIVGPEKRISLGYFTEKSHAIEARKIAEAKYGYHPNHGALR